MGPSEIWAALVTGTRNTLMIASVAGSIGVIVGIIGLTGLGLRFSGLMLSLTGESLFLAMLVVALTATVLGAGAPITATYVILAVLVPPALATLGVSVDSRTPDVHLVQPAVQHHAAGMPGRATPPPQSRRPIRSAPATTR